MNEQTQKQLESILGPSAPSDHAPGDVVKYTDGEQVCEGKVIMTRAAG